MTDFLKFKIAILAGCLIAFAISLSVVGSASAQVRHGAVIAYQMSEQAFAYYEKHGLDDYQPFGLSVLQHQYGNTEALATKVSDWCRKGSIPAECKMLFSYTSCAASFHSLTDEIYVAATGDTDFDARSPAKKECKRLGGKNCKIRDLYGILHRQTKT